jgi:hypothetical protein
VSLSVDKQIDTGAEIELLLALAGNSSKVTLANSHQFVRHHGISRQQTPLQMARFFYTGSRKYPKRQFRKISEIQIRNIEREGITALGCVRGAVNYEPSDGGDAADKINLADFLIQSFLCHLWAICGARGDTPNCSTLLLHGRDVAR